MINFFLIYLIFWQSCGLLTWPSVLSYSIFGPNYACIMRVFLDACNVFQSVGDVGYSCQLCLHGYQPGNAVFRVSYILSLAFFPAILQFPVLNLESINQSIIYLNQAEAHKNRLDRQGSMRK